MRQQVGINPFRVGLGPTMNIDCLSRLETAKQDVSQHPADYSRGLRETFDARRAFEALRAYGIL